MEAPGLTPSHLSKGDAPAMRPYPMGFPAAPQNMKCCYFSCLHSPPLTPTRAAPAVSPSACSPTTWPSRLGSPSPVVGQPPQVNMALTPRRQNGFVKAPVSLEMLSPRGRWDTTTSRTLSCHSGYSSWPSLLVHPLSSGLEMWGTRARLSHPPSARADIVQRPGSDDHRH